MRAWDARSARSRRAPFARLALAWSPGGAGPSPPQTRGFKSPNNCAEYARFYTAANTCRKNKRNVLEYLSTVIKAALFGKSAPQLILSA
jgi:hypothetical protein